MRVVVGFETLGPYHLARLNALGRCSQLLGLELYGKSKTYDWNPTLGEQCDFQRLTLFSGSSGRPSRSTVTSAVQKALKSYSPDVVFIPGWYQLYALSMLDWCNRNNVPAVVMSESNAFDTARGSAFTALKSIIARRFSAALVGGSSHRDNLVRLGIKPSHIEIGYDVVDNAHFSAVRTVRRPHIRPYLLASARFIAIKNLDGLFRAFARARIGGLGDDVDLVVLGDGAERKNLESLRNGLGLTDRILLPGFIQYADLPAWYQNAQGFLHVSAVEPWGLVVNEAMAAGLPIIVSKACGASELVSEGKNGWVVDHKDTSAIADRMIKIVHDGALRERMGQHSKEFIAAYGPSKFAAGALAAAAHALKAPPPRRGIIENLLATAVLARSS